MLNIDFVKFSQFDNGCRFGFCITFGTDKTRMPYQNVVSRISTQFVVAEIANARCSRSGEHSGRFFTVWLAAHTESVSINQYPEPKLILNISMNNVYANHVPRTLSNFVKLFSFFPFFSFLYTVTLLTGILLFVDWNYSLSNLFRK